MEKTPENKWLRTSRKTFKAIGGIAAGTLVVFIVKSCNDSPSHEQMFDACVAAGENGQTTANIAGMNIDCGDTFLPED